jgi:hypothetical protein
MSVRPIIPALAFAAAVSLYAASPRAADDPRAFQREHLRTQTRVGDFDMMLERRSIRVLVPYSRTLYFSDRGHERGLSADIMRDFERYLNQVHRKELKAGPSPSC